MSKSVAVVVVLSVVISVALVSSGIAFFLRSKENANTWHAVICSIEQAVIEDPKQPREEKVRFIKFYDGLLVNQVHTQPCGFVIPEEGR